MESEQRGRASRASSTSSLGREVRCGCQYYQSDSLLPERRALLGRPPSRTMQQPPAVRCSEHEYEPIAAPSPSPKPASAPVVRITETDVAPVADSDDSIDDRARLPPELTRAGDVILPLDGKIEDTAMEGRELVETGDTSEELESPQQLQERLEERFLNAATPATESRTDGEVNTSQVDSSTLEELPLRRGARGLPQRLKTQAGKLRSRLRNIQRPTFGFAERQKPDKARSISGGKTDRSRAEKRPSRMDRIRSSLSERPRFSLPSRPRISLPDRSRFHLPDRPRFNIKRPNIRLPSALTRTRKSSSSSPPLHEQRSTDSTIGSRKNIFDFSAYPRIFDKRSKSRGEYATSTPKDSRAQSTESSTFPRSCKGPSASERWARRFGRGGYIDEDRSDVGTAAERSRPWRQSSTEEPRLSIGIGEETTIPWEVKRGQEVLRYMDYEQESPETSDRQARARSEASRTEDESYDRERGTETDAGSYRRQTAKNGRVIGETDTVEGKEDRRTKEQMDREEFRPVQRSRSLEEVSRVREEERYEGTFAMVDPRRYGVHKTPSEEEEYDEEMEEEEEEEEDEEEEDEEHEPSSAQSDREQQHSSGSSCDRRRRGVIEEIDSDEFFLRESGISQDDMNLGKYLTDEIRDALRPDATNMPMDDDGMPIPPQRPTRKRSARRQRENWIESYDTMPPVRPKRDPNRIRRSESIDEQFRERARSDSRHRVVYRAEGSPAELPIEPLDDIVVVKPTRRKSRSSQRGQSQLPAEVPRPPSPATVPPVVPTRRKRLRNETHAERRNGEPVCNGHAEWADPTAEGSPSSPPTCMDQPPSGDGEAYAAIEGIATTMTVSEENVQKLAVRLREEECMEPVPIPPKRRSRSRGTSVAQDEDRTSHGAESLPEAGYAEEDIPRDEPDYGRDLSGYAIIEKREKPPRPPPPRRKREKFATAPRAVPPKRTQRAYGTLDPDKLREANILTDTYDVCSTLRAADSAPYIEIDSDDGEHRDLRSDEVLSKMQGRPLPAPPRPPRARKDRSLERPSGPMQRESIAAETTTATQTDPLPDDMVIEEEVTQAKLIVAPSMSGSLITVSAERIPSPSSACTPPVPPLPASQRPRKDEHRGDAAYDTVSLKSASPPREIDSFDGRHLSAPDLEETTRDEDDARLRSVRNAVLAEEPVRIGNLEVGDLRVDRLSVSQIEADKIVASEVDALVITASELKSITGMMGESLSPSIVKELIAIRSHLETVAATRARASEIEGWKETEATNGTTDVPVAGWRGDDRTPEAERPTASRGERDTEDETSTTNEEQKVVKREVIETREKEITRARTISMVGDDVVPVTRTLTVGRVELDDNDIAAATRSPVPVVRCVDDKSLRIFDSETPLSLSTGTANVEPKVDETRASLTPPVTATRETDWTIPSMESRLSPERMSVTGDEQTEATIGASKVPFEFSTLASETKEREGSPESVEQKTGKSRSRSPSPISISQTRQTASPVRSLPPAISVTPDTPDSVACHGTASETQPQRAVISYTSSSYTDLSDGQCRRESSQTSVPSFPLGGQPLIAFPASQVPAQFFSLAGSQQRAHPEPSVADSTRQLLRVLRLAAIKAMRRFVGYMTSVVGREESREKIREVEITLCALLLLIAGLLIFFFGGTRTVTHHHHWDYFNPPK